MSDETWDDIRLYSFLFMLMLTVIGAPLLGFKLAHLKAEAMIQTTGYPVDEVWAFLEKTEYSVVTFSRSHTVQREFERWRVASSKDWRRNNG